ncbi:MAG: hypothetical protein KF841_07660 [Phycisphaerae bacterium]|nr:hypothetical protein [Phycisphaerae bacterium]
MYRAACRRFLIVTAFVSAASPASSVIGQPPPPPLPPLPPVPVPAQNPITEPKRVLGKILFWDEQLSSDNSIACGTCHKPGFGGTDPRVARNPGLDGNLNTPDDIFASPGVVLCDQDQDFKADDIFGFQRQITPRAANPAIMAMFAPEIFWDGRARSTFVNPETGSVSIPTGGALESQAVGPILSEVEMGHEGRDWAQIAAKLAIARPMVLAEALPSDISSALLAHPTYPGLFQSAFGDSAITAERIAFAIATYERTLIPNETPWDRFNAGQAGAMTQQQIQGFNVLQGSPCVACHTAPQFTNNSFQNIGIRPVAEDRGRQNVTGLAVDRGRFKVPTLRNVGLKPTFMHNGVFSTLQQVIGFYANPAAQFPDNKSPLLPIGLPPQAVGAVIDFLSNGLTDPRVRDEQFPFDRPRLQGDNTVPNPRLIGGAVAGSGGRVPQMIAVSPPNVMNLDFKVGVANALGGAQAYVAWSESPPVNGQLVGATLHGPISLPGDGPGAGFATWKQPIDETIIEMCSAYVQWQIVDPAAIGGFAKSPIAHLRMVPYLCASGDMNCDGSHDGLDVEAFLDAVTDPASFGTTYEGCAISEGDFNADGVVNLADLPSFAWALVKG